MSASNLDDPLKWSFPRNQRSTSCYIDSALWAILYKRDNGIYQLINDFDKANFNTNISACSQDNLETIQTNLINFYNNIIIPNQNLSNFVTDILKQFTNCNITQNNDEWLSEQQDASQVLDQISKIFEAKTPDINNISFTETSTYVQTNDVSFNKETTSKSQSMVTITCKPDVSKTPKAKIFTDNDDTINLYNLKKYVINNKNTLNITGEIENWDPKNDDVEDNTGIKQQIKTKQLNYTYSTKNKNPIDSIILNISRFGFTTNSIKTNYNVNFPFKIGDLVLSSIIVHNGSTIEGGHYYCYFRVENNWFEMNDTSGIRSVNNIINEPNISSGCTTLVYFLETEPKILDNSTGYFCELFAKQNGGYPERILVDDATAQNELPEDQRLALSKSPSPKPTSSSAPKSTTTSSAQSSSLPKGQTTTPKKTVQTVDKCEKYGEEWLNLFIAENAAPGSSIEYVENPDGTKTARVKDKKTGIVTSFVAADENCTFVQSNGLTKSATLSNIKSLTTDELKRLPPGTPIWFINKPQKGPLSDAQEKKLGFDTAGEPIMCDIGAGSKCNKFKAIQGYFLNQADANKYKEFLENNTRLAPINLAALPVAPKQPQSLSGTPASTVKSSDVFNDDEIEDDIKELDLAKVYTTLNTKGNLTPYEIYIVLKNNDVENTVLNSSGKIDPKYYKPDGDLIDDITGIFLDESKANTAAANTAAANQSTGSSSPLANPPVISSQINSSSSRPLVSSVNQLTGSQPNSGSLWFKDDDNNVIEITPNSDNKYIHNGIQYFIKNKFPDEQTAKNFQERLKTALTTVENFQKNITEFEKLPNNIQDIINTAKQSNITTFEKVPLPSDLNKINKNSIIFFDNKIYIVINKDNLYDVEEKKNVTKSRTDAIWSGGTRRKRNRNTNAGTRKGKRKRHLRKTHKLRKSKRTRKHIRHKNKLKTNKLRRTRKRNLNKRRTRKA